VAMLDVDTTQQSASVSGEPETGDGASPTHHDEQAAGDRELVHPHDASGNSPSAPQAPANTDGHLAANTDIQIVEDSSPENAQNEGEEDAIIEEDPSPKDDRESPIPGLCDAGMRPPQQVSHFKACLRRSIQFVDAVLCKPPPGKTCTRNCAKVRERQCSGRAGPGTGIRCQDRLCRNWHETEAHTERCKNPLCEFGNRILLREMRHQIANQDLKTQSLLLKWEEKAMEQIAATTNGSGQQCTPVQLAKLTDANEKLERSITEAKEETESLETSKRVLLANLSAIGVKPQDDVRDGFPDFETHYK
jgi:hypothetical protein